MIHTGDCLEVMATLDAESIDAIVTDPPYDLTSGKRGGSGLASVNLESPYGRARIGTGNGGGFMGKAWDSTGIAFDPATWEAVLRVAKPGAYLLAFGGTRTVHRMTCAIEDAGWEIRDTLVWAYASGFPKSANPGRTNDVAQCRLRDEHSNDAEHLCAMISPAEWYGLGTALKPAWEPIVMARKPLRGTVAASVLEFGTGALNIDGCRIGFASDADRAASVPGTTPPSTGERGSMAGPLPRVPFSRMQRQHADTAGMKGLGDSGFRADHEQPMFNPAGRWPANVILTDPIFDGDWDGVVGGGEQRSGKPGTIRGGVNTGAAFGAESRAPGSAMVGFGDSGSYSRFFIIPKASRKDREPALGGLGTTDVRAESAFSIICAKCNRQRVNVPGAACQCDEPEWVRKSRTARFNVHPTVKPVALMRHLVRLVTPPGGTVLDPFLGSGTTALAAEKEGFAWMGIEREAEYVAIAEARLMDTFLARLQDKMETL